MKIALFGYGNMGQLIEKLALKQGHQVLGAATSTCSLDFLTLQQADVIIDFSSSECLLKNLKLACAAQKPIVIGTTGWDCDKVEAERLVETAAIGAIASPNFSLGVALFFRLLETAKQLFTPFEEYESAGFELHHSQKQDAPSGTAMKMAEMLGTPPFSSVRCGHLPGTHSVLFDSPCDTITLTHSARNRDGFAFGALRAATWILEKKGWHTVDDMLRSLYCPHHSI